jgi:predicted GNAT family N-acyltransferase
MMPMSRLRCGSWEVLGEDARSVRLAVFVAEQGIPEADEWDSEDATAIHAVLQGPDGLPLATGRLILSGDPEAPQQTGPGHARIGRMAVLRTARGQGVGRKVLKALIEQARLRGFTRVGLHAQVEAMPFYALAGFQAEGPVFDEVGIPHQRMTLVL